MLATRDKIARLQSDFYRHQYYKMMRLIMASIIVMYLCLAIILYLVASRALPPYYANTTIGRILNMPPAVSLPH